MRPSCTLQWLTAQDIAADRCSAAKLHTDAIKLEEGSLDNGSNSSTSLSYAGPAMPASHPALDSALLRQAVAWQAWQIAKWLCNNQGIAADAHNQQALEAHRTEEQRKPAGKRTASVKRAGTLPCWHMSVPCPLSLVTPPSLCAYMHAVP